MTVGEAVAVVEQRLMVAGVPEPRLDAQMLVAHALGAARSWVIAHTSDPIEDTRRIESLCERRERREPLAYILGWREFYGRRFKVTPDVLIPRQETETLVEVALSMPFVERVLDVGTGSGCIAVTLALEKPEWQVEASDISPGALAVAHENAFAHGIRLRTHECDLFEGLVADPFDLIVSNPPYVALGAILDPELTDHEPHSALFAGQDGLDAYRRLAEGSAAFLRPGGALLVELGDGMSREVARVFEEAGWHVERIEKDLIGIERVMVLRPLEV